MKPALLRIPALFLCVALAPLGSRGATILDAYQPGPDSKPQPGVPHGVTTPWEVLPSQAYPGTVHDFCVYVPAQYDPSRPACLMVFQDGHAWLNPGGEIRVPIVFDNLIYRREMPVTIAVFINPGRTPAQAMATDKQWGDQGSNRPQEYNALDDKYARVVVDELMPVLARRYKISPDPDDHAIAGASSGAVAAFTVAWQRPNAFHKVLSTIGSFTNIRGGDAYPGIIRSTERKPLRVYLLDGVNDIRGRKPGAPRSDYNPRMDWHAQNILMMQALTAKGYDLNYSWGIGIHSQNHAGEMLPEMLRWLWRDYPRPDDPFDDSNRGLYKVPGQPAPPASGPRPAGQSLRLINPRLQIE